MHNVRLASLMHVSGTLSGGRRWGWLRLPGSGGPGRGGLFAAGLPVRGRERESGRSERRGGGHAPAGPAA